MGSEMLIWVVFAACAVATITPTILALIYSSEYGFFYVPFASWFVFVLGGLLLITGGTALYFWRRFRKVDQELAKSIREPLNEALPAVSGYKHLDKPEFLALIQSLFRRPSHIRYVHVQPLPGGYGGSTTVLAELQLEHSDTPLPRSFVVKLGDKREMAGEHDKFHQYVSGRLSHAAEFFRHAEWGTVAGIAYQFVGLGLDSEIRSLHQCYQSYVAVEVAALVKEAYAHLCQAWYMKGQTERVNLYHEYGLLSRKKELIVGHVEEILDEDDPCRVNLAASEGRLRPKLKPLFCSDPDIPWYDPVAFVRMWPQKNLTVPVRQSVVHGDLHARNVLIEIGQGGDKRVWFIDFSHTGNGLSADRTQEALREGVPINPGRGHTLRDFCRLEADIKFVLTKLQEEDDLRLAVEFERELMACGLALYDVSANQPLIQSVGEERFRKAWQVIREIRRQASVYLINADDLRPYYLGLLHSTLPILYYHPAQFENEVCELQQKRYAFIAAGMLCSEL